ncbi:MAG TPA: ABC transporter ATP-binding protein [Daejeonella sp.]|uniref:ABC transporter ATP-binding protein n=1 Tax=Daejeonella sp. TaxID=2805397 RepID=UPI002ED93B51
MIRRAKFFLSIFLASELRHGMFILLLAMVVSLLEIVGIASMMPFFALIGNPQSISTNGILSFLYASFGFETYSSFIMFIGVAVIGVIAFSNLVKGISAHYTNLFTGSLRQSLQSRLLKSYVNQPYKYFLGKNTSELNKIIWSDIEFVIGYGVTPLLQMFSNIILLFLAIILISIVQFKVAVSIMLLVSSFALIFWIYLRNRSQNTATRRGEAAKHSYIVLNEVLGGIKDVKVYQKESNFIEKFNKNNKIYANLWAKSTTVAQLPKFVLETVAFSLLIGVTLIMLYTLKDIGELLPVLGVYAFAAYKIIPAIQIIFQGISSLKQGWPSLQIIQHDLQSTEAEEDIKSLIMEIPFSNSIKLNSIVYRYPNSDRKILDGLDLTINCNSTVGIVGGTGAGKTTLVDLLLGLHEPESGTISVDSLVICHENIHAWKNMIGYVPQTIFLTDATITENIAFGLGFDEIDFDNVKRASKLASLDEFIMNDLPDQYNTIVGERGVRLSGGQRQRLGIARALYRNPKVLILDEATSSLDNITETYIIKALDNIKGSCTIIIIAHRFTTIQKCDNIIILKDGQIVDEGIYNELIETSKEFKKLSLTN